ncbi:MAG TPA: pitrilysin family protein [Terriglobia bacterium]|nr:pitrilysin family protein [Terriglobia bacterium]
MAARIRMTVSWFCAGLLWGAAFLFAADFPPSVPPPTPVHLASPAVHVLPNGMRVAVIERHGLPIIDLRVVVRSGAEADPPELPGTAQMVASLLNQGTTRRTAQEIARAIDQVGGTIDNGADWDNSYIALSFLSDQTELAYELLAEMTMHPGFLPAEIERQRKQELSALSVAKDDPAYVADAVFDRLAFAGTPYGHPPDGVQESVSAITAADIREFYHRYYRPDNSILIVIGDIRAEDGFRLASKYFSNWKDEGTPSTAGRAVGGIPNGGSPATENTRQIVVIDKPDAVQTEIRLGNRGIPRSSSDYLALTVANQILGGPATNRLYKALRTEHGLTYSASSELDCYQTLGSWESKTFTRTAETIPSLRLALEQMKRLRDHPITEGELETAQSYLTGHLALEVESPDGIATQTLNLMVYHLPLDYWNQFPDELRTLQTKEVLNATRRYMDPDHDIIVLVGNASAFTKDLKKLGDARVIPIHSLDLASPDLERPNPPPANR